MAGKNFKLEVVRGVHGHMSVYLDDFRIGGAKPWGGGKTIHSFTTTLRDLEQALPAGYKIIKVEDGEEQTTAS